MSDRKKKIAADTAAKTAREQHTRPKGKPFVKGRSGNPSGRPRGAKSVATLIASSLLEEQAVELVQRAVKMASGGDQRMLEFLLGKLLPSARARPVTIPGVPVVTSLADVGKAADAILRAVSAGIVAPEEAGALTALVECLRRSLEARELEHQVEKLSEKLDGLMAAQR